MTIVQAIVLGVIQGLTEFLPISSSAHLALTPHLFGWNPEHFSLAFDVALHTGTLLAVLWYFRADWSAMTVALIQVARTRRADTVAGKRALFLGVAFVPAVIGGLLLEDYADTVFRQPAVIAYALIFFGLIMWAVDRAVKALRPLENMRLRDAVIIGVAQVLALVPGVSRSGATMTAGRVLSFDRTSAARFSFLMSMPVIAAAAVRKVPEVLQTEGITLQLIAGTSAAAITGWLAISFLLQYLTRRGFAAFGFYRVLLGIYVLVFASG